MKALTIDAPCDLCPFDMIEEGIFIKQIDFTFADQAGVRVVVGTLEIVEEVIDDNISLKTPQWRDIFEMRPTFPLQVLRGIH